MKSTTSTTRRPLHGHSSMPEMSIRLKDLDLCLEGSVVEKMSKKLLAELSRRGLFLKPSLWVSTEWFCLDGTTSIAVPFYLLDQNYRKLEKSEVGYIDGSSETEIIKILRHEMGHVMENAYGLKSHPLRTEIFGSAKKSYPKSYQPKKYSTQFVKNLSDGYAQSHPDEDFAETFAVWLQPKHIWMIRYKSKPECLKKLLAVDHLMDLIKSGKIKRRKTNESRVDEISKLKISLAQHYSKKRRELNIRRKLHTQKEVESLAIKIAGRRNAGGVGCHITFEDLASSVAEALGMNMYQVRPVISEFQKLVKKSVPEDILLRKSDYLHLKDLIILELLDRAFYRQDRIYL